MLSSSDSESGPVKGAGVRRGRVGGGAGRRSRKDGGWVEPEGVSTLAPVKVEVRIRSHLSFSTCL